MIEHIAKKHGAGAGLDRDARDISLTQAQDSRLPGLTANEPSFLLCFRRFGRLGSCMVRRRVLSRAQPAGIAGLPGIRTAKLKSRGRVIGEHFQVIQHSLQRFLRSFQRCRLPAILLVREVAGEMYLFAAKGHAIALKRGKFIGKASDVLHNFCHHNAKIHLFLHLLGVLRNSFFEADEKL